MANPWSIAILSLLILASLFNLLRGLFKGKLLTKEGCIYPRKKPVVFWFSFIIYSLVTIVLIIILFILVF